MGSNDDASGKKPLKTDGFNARTGCPGKSFRLKRID
jgi:hypothetical protein